MQVVEEQRHDVKPVCPMCAVTGGYVSPIDVVGVYGVLPRIRVGMMEYITDAPRRW